MKKQFIVSLGKFRVFAENREGALKETKKTLKIWHLQGLGGYQPIIEKISEKT